MNKAIIISSVILLIGIGSAEAIPTHQEHADCFSENDDDEFCLNRLMSDYRLLHGSHENLSERYNAQADKHDIIMEMMQNRSDAKIESLEGDVKMWKAQYYYVITQHGNSTIQDKVANLTARVDAVETKAATNESLIYIIQNMLRTVQTDIEDIYLKINSVR